MYAVVVYDVGVERVNAVRVFLKQYLNWIQNSVVEGELTEVEFMEVSKGIKELIHSTADNVIIYTWKDKKYMGREEFGMPKAEISEII